VLGPLVFGAVVAYTGSGRQAIIAVLVFFVAGAALLVPVDIADGRRQARAAEEAIEAAH
jgi:UMF1 family MFS transporter